MVVLFDLLLASALQRGDGVGGQEVGILTSLVRLATKKGNHEQIPQLTGKQKTTVKHTYKLQGHNFR